MEIADLQAVLEEARKVFSMITDAAVWADLFHKTVSGQIVPNPVHLPGYARKNSDTVGFNIVMAQLDPGEKLALELHWIPSLDPIQNDDLAITIASIACSDPSAAKTNLKVIAAVPDPDPANPKQSRKAILKRINAARTKMADSLNLVKCPVERYPQFYIDQVKGGVFGSGAAFVKFLQANWPTVRKTILSRVKGIDTAIGKSAYCNKPATGLVAKADNFRARMKAKYDASKH